jgi:hypothetical protein
VAKAKAILIMKVFKFWLEIAKGFLNVWDDVSTSMDYSPFANGKKTVTNKASQNPKG